jgi:hypothetical protein
MKRLSCIGTALLIVTAMSTAAWADDPPASGAAPAAPPPEHAAMASHKFTGDAISYYITGNVSDNPFLSVGITFPNGLTFAIGGALDYVSGGLPVNGVPSADKTSFQGLLYGAYYFYNKFPVGVAAELAVVAPFAPKYDVLTFQPGLAIYYAPFAAPIVIGTALDLQINSFRDVLKPLGTEVKTLTPGVRLVYVFP